MTRRRTAPGEVRHGDGFVEIADRCWVARHEFLDVNVGLVAGERGVLVVDTLASESLARRVVEDVRRLGVGEVVAVVNTHDHFDHTFGNVVLAEEYDAVEVIAHEDAATALAEAGPTLRAEAAAYAEDPENQDETLRLRHREIAETRILVPEQTFSSARVVDLGDRQVELIHPGRGHTAGDTVLRVPDADLLWAGDLVEESTLHDGVPGFGADCFPMEWPVTLDLVISMLSAGSVVVPGHGAPVGLDFVRDQRGNIGTVAETLRSLAGRGVPAADALGSADWPYPAERLEHAVARGYRHLSRAERSLPML